MPRSIFLPLDLGIRQAGSEAGFETNRLFTKILTNRLNGFININDGKPGQYYGFRKDVRGTEVAF